MTLTKEKIDYWEWLLGQAKLEEALNDMSEAGEDFPPPLRNTFLNLSGQFNELRQREVNNLLAESESALQRNQLRSRLLDLLDLLYSHYLKAHRAGLSFTLAADELQFRQYFQERLTPQRYTLVECLWNGDYANVYQALKNAGTPLEETVAIKVFKTLSLIDDDNLRDLGANLALAKRKSIGVDGIIPIIDENLETLPRYYVMPFISGMPLKDRLLQGWPFTLREIRRILMRVAEALHSGHIDGLVHNNLRPSNIFLSRRGDPKIIPFQMVRFTWSQRHFQRIGELARYASPEQINAEPTIPAADQYALGLIAFELFRRQPLFAGRNIMEVMQKRLELEQDPQRLERELEGTGCPPAFVPVIRRMLERDPACRYEDLEQVYDAVDRLIPLPESTPDEGRQQLERSFEQCRRQTAFYHTFYQQFLQLRPAARQYFEEAFDQHRRRKAQSEEELWRYQYRMLDLAIDRLLTYVSEAEHIQSHVDELMVRHRSRGIDPVDFPVFLDCLRDTLIQHDRDRWTTHRESLEKAWQEIVGLVLNIR